MGERNQSLWAALLLIFSGTDSAAGDLTHYQVVFEQNNMSEATVEAEVTITDRKLRMASWGHPHLPRGWATFVSGLKISDLNGVAVDFVEDTEETWGAWLVEAEDGTRLNLQYTVEFSQSEYDWSEAGGEDSRPAVTPDALFLVTKALFIYSPNMITSTEVAISTPEDWIVSSPWQLKNDQDNVFQVNDWISLVNNALVVGKHSQTVMEASGMTFSLAVDPNLTEFTDLFNDTLRMQFHAFVKMFGDAPDSRYLVTIREAQADDGESFEDSFNQVIAPGRISERSIVWANTLGHELFHYWNGNHFLVGDSKETVEWFGEGFTEYYASLALLRTGVISEELWLRKLETYLARYFISTQMWPEEPPSLVAAGSEKHKNWLRIYGGGATVALVLDIEIRAVTQGSKGLDDVMLLLVDRFGLPGGCYTNQDILVAVNDVSGRDFTSFFDTHVFGLQASFDFQTILAKAGITSEQFADEFYLSRTPQASPLQIEIFDGITKPRYLETEQ